jgi:hypothetical protein
MADTTTMLDLSLHTGDTRDIIVTAKDLKDNSIIDLTNATIVCVIVKGETVVMTKTIGSGITVANPPTGGQFIIALTADDTKALLGSYTHQTRITIDADKSEIVLEGMLNITKAYC